MALVNCKECGKQVSQMASKCPFCGISHPGIHAGKGCLGIIALAVVFALMTMCSSDKNSVAENQKKHHNASDSSYSGTIVDVENIISGSNKS